MFWTQRQDIGPGARAQAAAAYDEERQRFVVFGGYGGPGIGDTWEWDGELWTQVADIGPSSRFLAAMAYDAERKCTVLFGGLGSSMLGDTWVWDGADWTQVADTGPVRRSSHAMAFDAARKEIVLYGGWSQFAEPGPVLGDTWVWDGADWTQKEDVGPGARYAHAMAFDAGRARTTMFGGGSSADIQTAAHGDTWDWDGAKWAQVAHTGPVPRWGHGMAFHGERVVLFGGAKGYSYPADLFGDTWAWDGKYWTEVQDIGPATRAFAAMAHDMSRERLVLFGGLSAAPLGDTWEWFDHSPAT